MEEKELNIEESLAVMQSMVNRAQKKLSDDGFLFIFWGWLVMLCTMLFYFLMKRGIENAWLVWMAMPAGGIFTMIYSMLQKKKEKVKSYMDTYMGYLWTAFGICLAITLTMGEKLQMNCYPIVIMLYATATFVTGGLIRFTPLIVCGLLSFPICIVAFFSSFENQILLLAVSVLISYIIPGHWLQLKAKKANGI